MGSLRLRLNLAAALVLLIFIAITALALERAFRESALASIEERLMAQLYLLMAAAEVDKEGTLQLPAILSEPRLELPDSGLYARIEDAQGQALWHSPSAIRQADDTFALPDEALQLYPLFRPGQGEQAFIASLQVDWETAQGKLPLRFTVAEDGEQYAVQMAGYRRSLWGWLGGMSVLLLLTLTAALAWGLRPLRQVAGEIRAIENGQQQELRGNYPREIRQLSDNLNALLHHERAQQGRYRHALADLAHSLKTPLAVLRGMEQTTEGVEEQVSRMDHIVQYQLQRAATAGRSAFGTPIPLAATVTRLLKTLHKVYGSQARQVKQDIAAELRFRGDEGDLLELLGNLLDNAFKWSRKDIAIYAEQRDGRLLLRVEDDGPGIPAERVNSVLQRGTRLDEITPGHGIGLAMVQDIVEAYQGGLQIDRSRLGGAAIQISLPGY